LGYRTNCTMMKLLIVASLLAGAVAFAPVSQPKITTSLAAVAKKPVTKVVAKKPAPKPVKKVVKKSTLGFANELGVQEPLGFWDPLKLLEGKGQDRFDRLRYVEIKHGRIAQLAFLGYITTEYGFRLPGNIDNAGDTFASIPGGFAALTAMPSLGLFQILLFIGWLEIAGWKQDPNSYPGDFSASSFPVGYLKKNISEQEKLKFRAQELNQGRAAQMGILALMVHEQLGVDILPPH
jgi:Chlorophyll A-B binding protein